MPCIYNCSVCTSDKLLIQADNTCFSDVYCPAGMQLKSETEAICIEIPPSFDKLIITNLSVTSNNPVQGNMPILHK